jgi:glutamate/aspartate transport system substrate-binding protein
MTPTTPSPVMIEAGSVILPCAALPRLWRSRSSQANRPDWPPRGSTTANAERREQVAFSPIFFIAGTKLMVPKASPVRSYRDLAGKTAVVTAGTTNEAALRALSDKQKLGISIISAPDHAQSLATLISGKADAFATDDVLLYGFIATDPNARDMKVVGEYLSYDPYGLAYRRNDRLFAAVVERAFARIAGERRLAGLSTTSGSCAGCRPARRS